MYTYNFNKNDSILKDFIYLFLEKGDGSGGEWERNINVRGKHPSVASCPGPDKDGTHALTRN